MYRGRTKRPTWKKYNYEQLQGRNISDGQCTACNSGYARRTYYILYSYSVRQE